MIGLSLSEIFAQHLDFMGVELGGDPKLMIDELNKQGYHRSRSDNDPYFYGDDCRILVLKEKNSNIYSDLKEIVYGIHIEFGYNYEFLIEEANTIISQIAESIYNSYKNEKIEVYINNRFMCYGGIGTLIILKSGFIEVYGVTNGVRKNINVRMYDYPDNYFFYQAKEQNGTLKSKTPSPKKSRKRKKR